MLQYWGGVLKKKFVKFVVQDLTSGGLLGVWGKWMKHAKYIYNIQDFNPEQVLAVGYTKSKLVTDAMMWFDKFSCKRSDLVITVGRDLVETVENRFKGKKVPKTVMINNWIDENEIYPLDENNEKALAFKKKYGLDGKFVIMYSGNIGLYYDLENLIKVVEKIKLGTKTADGREVVFAFVGAGSVLDKLVLYVKEHHMDNVVFIPYQDKADLIYSLNAGDVHWCVNAKGIKGVSCPSKAYGIMAAAKPILGVLESGSEVRCLIEDTNGGLCCEPGEYDKVEENIRWFIENAGSGKVKAMGARGRENLEKNLTRNVSVRKYGLKRERTKQQMRDAIAKGTLMKDLQWVPVKKDDLFFIEAGTIHAIGAGALVAEIQENSNLTYRLYDYDRVGKDGKKRELHIDKALDVANLKGSAEPKQPLRVLKYRQGIASELLTRCKYFEVYRMIVNTERRQKVHYRADEIAFRVLLCVNGCGTISYQGGTIPFYKGDCIFVPADSETLTIHGQAQFLDVRG